MIDKLKDLVSSPDKINRELGVILAISSGIDMNEFYQICFDHWYAEGGYSGGRANSDYVLNELAVIRYENAQGEIQKYNSYEVIYKQSISDYTLFKQLIKLFIESEHPHLLSKI